jgi:hypothetical protein
MIWTVHAVLVCGSVNKGGQRFPRGGPSPNELTGQTPYPLPHVLIARMCVHRRGQRTHVPCESLRQE